MTRLGGPTTRDSLALDPLQPHIIAVWDVRSGTTARGPGAEAFPNGSIIGSRTLGLFLGSHHRLCCSHGTATGRGVEPDRCLRESRATGAVVDGWRRRVLVPGATGRLPRRCTCPRRYPPRQPRIGTGGNPCVPVGRHSRSQGMGRHPILSPGGEGVRHRRTRPQGEGMHGRVSRGSLRQLLQRHARAFAAIGVAPSRYLGRRTPSRRDGGAGVAVPWQTSLP